MYVVAVILLIMGALLVWLPYMVFVVSPPQGSGSRWLLVILLTGPMIGFLGGVLGALSSPPAEGHQKLGFFLVAAVFMFLLWALPLRITYYPYP